MVWPEYRGKDRHFLQNNWHDVTVLDFPRIVSNENIFIKTERQFALLIGTSRYIQRSLGWHSIVNNNVFYPDVTAMLDCGETLRCELEYDASCFLRHKHSGLHCDLILSFVRRSDQVMIKGVPVWSFYVKNENDLIWSLNDDISNNGIIDSLEYGFQLDQIGYDIQSDNKY